MGADDIDPDGAREAEIEAARGLIFAPELASKLLQWFLELKGVSMDRDFELANRVAAGEVANGVSGEEKDDTGLACHVAQLRERVALVSGKPILQEVDVVGHAFSCFWPPQLQPSA
jgi:hypothetical protein